jgi:nicotinamide-nucleotide amidase
VNAHIITIGDELLIGQVINTNQAEIADALGRIGINPVCMLTVGDNLDEILMAFTRAWEKAQVTVVTGGLGPTHDDITREAVCKFFETDLVNDPAVRRHVEELFRKRNRPWTAAAENQTMVPRGTTVIPNPIGTAPGIQVTRNSRHMLVLPGVPYEMKAMLVESVVPFLTPLVGDTAIRHLTFRTVGVPESALADELGDLGKLLGQAKLAFLPSAAGVRMRVTVHSKTSQAADEQLELIEQRLRSKVGKHIYGTGEEEIEEVLGRLLLARKLTLAVAESCTGGLIAHRLTNVSGSSGYFRAGVIAYSNEAKSEILGVDRELINTHGAVSRQVAEAMATGVRTVMKSEIGISTTGIAGPTGGTPEKPVGLVWIGYANATETMALRFTFGEGRLLVKERAANAAFELARRKLLKL